MKFKTAIKNIYVHPNNYLFYDVAKYKITIKHFKYFDWKLYSNRSHSRTMYDELHKIYEYGKKWPNYIKQLINISINFKIKFDNRSPTCPLDIFIYGFDDYRFVYCIYILHISDNYYINNTHKFNLICDIFYSWNYISILKIMKKFIKSGIDIDINAKDVYGLNPLSIAYLRRNYPLVEFLMKHNAIGATPIKFIEKRMNEYLIGNNKLMCEKNKYKYLWFKIMEVYEYENYIKKDLTIKDKEIAKKYNHIIADVYDTDYLKKILKYIIECSIKNNDLGKLHKY